MGSFDWLENKRFVDGRKSRALKAQRMRRYHSSVFYHGRRNGTQVIEDLLGRPWSEELDVLHDPLMGLKKRNQGLMLTDEMGRSLKNTKHWPQYTRFHTASSHAEQKADLDRETWMLWKRKTHNQAQILYQKSSWMSFPLVRQLSTISSNAWAHRKCIH